MKRFIRLRAVQWALSYLVSFYIDFTLWTMRWTIVNEHIARTAAAAPEGCIGCFWHGRIALAVFCRGVLKGKDRRVVISLSRDGQFIADAVARLGFPAIRGSTERAPGDNAKGAVAALQEAVLFLRNGGGLAVTPDGPRGPNEIMSEGPVNLARVTGVNVFVCGLAAHPAIISKGWDNGRFPLPFTRGCAVFDGPFRVPRDADRESREAIRLEWQEKLCAAQAKAEAVVTGRAG